MENATARNSSHASQLCYLDAAHLEGPLSDFEDVDIVSGNNRKLGTLAGVIVEPERRQLRYLVVEADEPFRQRRYLLPLAQTRVDADRHVLCVDADRADLRGCDEFDPALYRRFSDDDFLTALVGAEQLAIPTDVHVE